MIRKPVLVALATIVIAVLPALIAAERPATGAASTVVQPDRPDYPHWMYEPAYPEPDWALMEQCWTGRDNSPAAVPLGCSGRYPLTLPCHWTVGYPDRGWVEEACGPISSWDADFGFSWHGHWDPHPARDWVARMRAGGQP